jgi:hypothetical protein
VVADHELRRVLPAALRWRPYLNHVGLLSEDLAQGSGVLWGNFPQTCSMAGVINGAVRPSRPWDDVV